MNHKVIQQTLFNVINGAVAKNTCSVCTPITRDCVVWITECLCIIDDIHNCYEISG